MLTPITSLKEIVSMVPDTPRKFQINKDELMGIDPTKAIAARTFIGVLIKSDDDIVTNGETCKFVEVFYEGGINITALLSDELKSCCSRIPPMNLMMTTRWRTSTHSIYSANGKRR